jgi:hypothetical protein
MSIVVMLDTQYGINYNSNKFFTAIRLQMKCNCYSSVARVLLFRI